MNFDHSSDIIADVLHHLQKYRDNENEQHKKHKPESNIKPIRVSVIKKLKNYVLWLYLPEHEKKKTNKQEKWSSSIFSSGMKFLTFLDIFSILSI